MSIKYQVVIIDPENYDLKNKYVNHSANYKTDVGLDIFMPNEIIVPANAISFKIGTGIKTSLLELTNTILEEYGSDLKIEFKEEGNTFVKNRVGDPTKAKKEIGFEYKIDLRKGIKDLIDWRKSIS